MGPGEFCVGRVAFVGFRGCRYIFRISVRRRVKNRLSWRFAKVLGERCRVDGGFRSWRSRITSIIIDRVVLIQNNAYFVIRFCFQSQSAWLAVAVSASLRAWASYGRCARDGSSRSAA